MLLCLLHLYAAVLAFFFSRTPSVLDFFSHTRLFVGCMYVERAVKKKWGIIMLDPNVRSDKSTFISTKLGYDNVACQWERVVVDNFKDGKVGLYILAHSQAGAQIVRTLENETTTPPGVLSSIAAIAQTDGTHSLYQLTRPALRSLLTSPTSSLYCRSTPGEVCLHSPGDTHKPTDDGYWKNRFGDTMKAVWAGTREHAYSNFTARDVIWDFFEAREGERGGESVCDSLFDGVIG